VLLRREGEPSGINRIYRLYREEGMMVRKRRARRKAIGTRAPILVEARPNARASRQIASQSPSGRWMQNGFVESFNGRMRPLGDAKLRLPAMDELLNETMFRDMAHARKVIRSRATDHNEERPHSALGQQTPKHSPKPCSPQPTPAPVGVSPKGLRLRLDEWLGAGHALDGSDNRDAGGPGALSGPDGHIPRGRLSNDIPER